MSHLIFRDNGLVGKVHPRDLEFKTTKQRHGRMRLSFFQDRENEHQKLLGT